MPGRRETLTRDKRKRSAARKRSHKETQQRQQEVTALLRRLDEAEKQAAQS